MLDLHHLPSKHRVADVKIFTRPGNVLEDTWQTWRLPRGATMISILCIGGGAGGGGGFSGSAGNPRGGGGGGGSGGCTRVTIPALFLPDTLYVVVGAGGLGGGSSTAGDAAARSFVSIYPVNTATNIVAVSGTAGAAGGSAGTVSAGGPGGSGSTIATVSIAPLSMFGAIEFIAGQSGVAGGDDTGADGTSITLPTTSIICTGGAGGGGATSGDFNGGGFNASTAWLGDHMPAAGGTPTDPNGSGGVQVWRPFFSFGGCGGAALNSAAGGRGGNGAFGGGGGGGGAGTTGGRGGTGGNGIVVITAW